MSCTDNDLGSDHFRYTKDTTRILLVKRKLWTQLFTSQTESHSKQPSESPITKTERGLGRKHTQRVTAPDSRVPKTHSVHVHQGPQNPYTRKEWVTHKNLLPIPRRFGSGRPTIHRTYSGAWTKDPKMTLRRLQVEGRENKKPSDGKKPWPSDAYQKKVSL